MTKIEKLKYVPPEKGFYIAGFVDGEGSFYISARKRKDYMTGWKFTIAFNIGNKDRAVLEICRKYLGCGKIRESRKDFYTFEVSNRETIKNFIIPFFKKFNFLSNKKKHEFSIFQAAVKKLDFGIHTKTDLEEILVFRVNLNKFRKTRISNQDEEIRQSFRV
uniref:LAGLIDADG homing endonuclease n=1 Tax=Hydrocytium acuminatum TaxID=1745963 RepID=UPI002A82C65F|nr:LAGLIDADG homing endonuclease [Hydrocytium acuminatum]WOR09573.1 LAGLIDADG homing endonuclease [Hydrocytium acuminatum]